MEEALAIAKKSLESGTWAAGRAGLPETAEVIEKAATPDMVPEIKKLGEDLATAKTEGLKAKEESEAAAASAASATAEAAQLQIELDAVVENAKLDRQEAAVAKEKAEKATKALAVATKRGVRLCLIVSGLAALALFEMLDAVPIWWRLAAAAGGGLVSYSALYFFLG